MSLKLYVLASVGIIKVPVLYTTENYPSDRYLYTYYTGIVKSFNLPKNMRVPREERGGRVDQTFVAVDVGIELVIAIRNAHCAQIH
jgi:hypothetical protein